MTGPDKNTNLTIKTAKTKLRAYAKGIDFNPQTNSVFALSQELFRRLEERSGSFDELEALTTELFANLIEKRAATFAEQHTLDAEDRWQAVRERLALFASQGWDAFRAAVEKAQGGIVFTGHPTFALPQTARAALVDVISDPTKAARKKLKTQLSSDARDWSKSISLKGEHEESQAAILYAQGALRAYVELVLSIAQEHFPQTWRTLDIEAPTVATWVGYDLDGRNDIHWSQSFALRLQEKQAQLRYYADRLAQLSKAADGHTLAEALDTLAADVSKAADTTASDYETFSKDLTVADNLVAAANLLTDANSARLVSSEPLIAQLKYLAARPETSAELANKLLTLAIEVKAFRFGTARIHLRLNAAQIRTVISRDLGLETENRELGRSALNKLSELADVSKPLAVNFADLFLEQSTARRQFMMCAQFLKHIDADSTIRFLIAESENPATVMGALYMARQYGVDHQLDISPLFETPEALETGGRFVEQLLAEPQFQKYLKTRKYLSIQLGFSDAGRFIGQVAADMAIERIHNLISLALSEKAPGIALLVFNTHGESMGRGSWPGSFQQRYDHLLTQWTRQMSQKRGVAIRHEVSFQGGDGYLHFANEALAEATYAGYCSTALADPTDAESDPFYSRTDLVWDFYRALRTWHERLFDDDDYAHLLSDFATNFLVKAGSRQRRRSSGPGGPRSLRAISHNATLQQLGVPLNTAAGIGSSLRRERDQVYELIQTSERMGGLIKLASRARSVMSIPVLRAYANVYDPSFWVALARANDDPEQTLAYRRIYYLLQDRQTNTSLSKISNMLSIDMSKFDPMLIGLDTEPTPKERREERLELHILHAVRIALMMKAMSIAGKLPTVSRRHAAGVTDIMNLIKSMEIGSAVAILREIFPASLEHEDALQAISEPGHMQDNPARGYDNLHAEIIRPLDEIDRMMHTLTLAISQAYGAYG